MLGTIQSDIQDLNAELVNLRAEKDELSENMGRDNRALLMVLKFKKDELKEIANISMQLCLSEITLSRVIAFSTSLSLNLLDKFHFVALV